MFAAGPCVQAICAPPDASSAAASSAASKWLNRGRTVQNLNFFVNETRKSITDREQAAVAAASGRSSPDDPPARTSSAPSRGMAAMLRRSSQPTADGGTMVTTGSGQTLAVPPRGQSFPVSGGNGRI